LSEEEKGVTNLTEVPLAMRRGSYFSGGKGSKGISQAKRFLFGFRRRRVFEKLNLKGRIFLTNGEGKGDRALWG